MTRVPPRLGTAEQHVLLHMTNPKDRAARTWNSRDGGVLYENRTLDERVCYRLAVRGFLDQVIEADHTVYTVNSHGTRAANKLRTAIATTPNIN